MRISAALLSLSVAALAVAQQQQIIEVGSTSNAPGGIFQFIPANITAQNGTVVTFRFTGAPGNHSVTQSSFTDPCDPNPKGFDAGWVSIPANNASTSPEFNLTITNSTQPIWFFCKQLIPQVHCSSGMVGAINAPQTGNNTFENYKKNAAAFKGNSGQGEAGGELVGLGASASAGPGPVVSGVSLYTAAVATATSPSNSTGSSSGSSPKPTGGAMGMVASAFVLPLGIALGAFMSLA